MSLEIVGGWLLKFGWSAIIPYLFWIKKQDKLKLDKTMSKEDTSNLIDLKIAPIEQKIDSNAILLEDKFNLLLELVKKENESTRKDNEKSDLQRKENNQMLHSINTTVAVIENEVNNLKERIDTNQ